MYVLRTTRVKPGTVPRFEQAIGEALGGAQRNARLAGCWHTEIGPLLQIVELWNIGSDGAQSDVGPITARELVQSVEVELLTPAPFMRELNDQPRQVGPIFELRIYQVKTGHIDQMVEKWGAKLPGREELSPMLGCWYSERGLWFHLWPYPDLATRGRIRAEAQSSGRWPPMTAPHLLSQETKIMLPAAFSPLQ